MPTDLMFCLLGPMRVQRGAVLVPVSPGKQSTLLAALLLNAGQVVPVHDLADLLWESRPPPSARASLQTYVMRLRKSLGDRDHSLITAGPGGYMIMLGRGRLDVELFESSLAAARKMMRAGSPADAAARLRAALALWRGQPLAGLASETLALREVPRLTEMRLQALEARIDADLILGHHAHVITELRQLAAVNPLRERLHALLMLALYRDGQQAGALAAYQVVRNVLVGELGTEPGPELRQLQQRILTADPELASPSAGCATAALQPAGTTRRQSAAAVVPRQLPSALPWFAGRSAELAVLAGMLDQRAVGPALISITGTAGVGKTALAVHWAHQMASQFGDGQLYVNLRGFTHTDDPASPAEAIRGFLDALGVAPERIPASLDGQAGLFRSLLADRKMLIVLDNARDEHQVRPLLPASPGCLVLVTSRAQLAGLAVADGARLFILDLPSHAEARQMLTLRLGAERATAEPAALDQIASLCARLPLAIAVVAARANTRPRFSITALADELGDIASRLDALDADDPVASVRQVFSWSHHQLSPEAMRTFQFLGLHPGPDITVPSTASLTATALPAARRALHELTVANLLSEQVPGRYAFHDLLRAYATELAQAADGDETSDEATGRILDHYLHTAHAAALLLQPTRRPLPLDAPRPGVAPEELAGHREAMAWFEAEHKILISAVTLAAQAGSNVCAWQLSWAMADFLDRRGHWHEWTTVNRMALDAAADAGDAAGQAAAHRAIAHACIRLADHEQARDHLGACLRLYEQLGDRAGQAHISHALGHVTAGQHRYVEAIGHDQRALALFQAISDPSGQAYVLNTLGSHHTRAGDARRARALCWQALELHRETEDRVGQGHAWDSLGYAEQTLGNLAAAITSYHNALAILGDLGDRLYYAQTLGRLGDAQHAANQPQQATEAWQQALKVLDDLHHPDANDVRAKLGR